MLQNTTKGYLIVSALIFGLVALIHLVRAFNSWSFVIGPVTIPVLASWVGFIITASMCLWALRLATSVDTL